MEYCTDVNFKIAGYSALLYSCVIFPLLGFAFYITKEKILEKIKEKKKKNLENYLE